MNERMKPWTRYDLAFLVGCVLFIIGCIVGISITSYNAFVQPELTRYALFCAYPWTHISMAALLSIGGGLMKYGLR